MENQKEPLISVIVPIYNNADYIDECLSSIVSQSYRNLEIILVENGSTDSAPAICDAWAAKDSRIRVFHEEALGPSGARNYGLQKTTGEYIAFHDPDDYMKPEFFLKLYNALISEKADVAMCHEIAFEDGSEPVPGPDCPYEVLSQRDYLLHYTDDFRGPYTWVNNKLYKACLVKEIPFPELTILEDVVWSIDMVFGADRIVDIGKRLYCYRQHGASLMHRKTERYYESWVGAISEEYERLRDSMPDSAKQAYYCKCLNMCHEAAKALKATEFAREKEDLRTLYRTIYSFTAKTLAFPKRFKYFLYKLTI